MIRLIRPTALAALSLLSAATFVYLSTPKAAHAQESLIHASVTGRVLDPTGAALVHVSVTALQPATNQKFTVQTDGQGRFRIPFLPIGQYRISAQPNGFSEVAQNVELSVGAAFDVTLRASVAQATSTVQVSSASPVIETDRSQIAETVQTAEVQNLPFEGRNYLDLALLLPGVSPTNTASTQTLAETSEVVGQGYSVNSQRNFSNSFIVDGLSNNDDARGGSGKLNKLLGGGFSFGLV